MLQTPTAPLPLSAQLQCSVSFLLPSGCEGPCLVVPWEAMAFSSRQRGEAERHVPKDLQGSERGAAAALVPNRPQEQPRGRVRQGEGVPAQPGVCWGASLHLLPRAGSAGLCPNRRCARQGKQKYTLPLYRAMWGGSEAARALAMETFSATAPQLHINVRNYVKKILGLEGSD